MTIPRALSPRARRRRLARRLARWTALAAALVAAGWAAWTYAIPHIEVPDLTGKTVDAATAEADAAGLELAVERQVFSGTVPAGAVVGQDPEGGDRVRRGEELSVVVSRGPELVSVPDVGRLPEAEAVRRLEEAKLDGEIRGEFHPKVREGRVIEQSPPGGTTIEAGETVVLTVSLGKPPVQVPEVVGRTEADAGALLQAAGLGVRVVEELSDVVPRGSVVRQTPPPGATVTTGSIVEVVVSKGPRRFPMPDVVGEAREAAMAELHGFGLVVREVQVPGSLGTEVVGQKPDPGEVVESGQEVTIYLGG